MKTFKPGNMQEVNYRNLPETPGTNKVQLFKKNKPSKGRINVNPNIIKKHSEKGHANGKPHDEINDNNMHYSDVGGDGGD